MLYPLYFRSTFGYNCGTKGSDVMTRYEQLDQLLAEHKGMIQTSQVVEAGISKPIFYDFVKEKRLQQVSHGVYVSEDTWVDELYILHLRCGQAVYSHETALLFHDLTDREPSPYSVAVKAWLQYKPPESGWNCRLYRQGRTGSGWCRENADTLRT